MFESLFDTAIADRVFPEAAWAVGRGSTLRSGFAGRETYSAGAPEVGGGTIWDLASLTKVVCTTAVAMLLTEQGMLSLDMPVCSFLPDFGTNGKAEISVRNLLTHNSGLAATGAFAGRYLNREQIFAEIDAASLVYPTGTMTLYSDLGFIALGRVLEAIGTKSLDLLFREGIAEPLNLHQAMFNPSATLRTLCAPTSVEEPWRTAMNGKSDHELAEDGLRYIRGVVHDPTAFMMGGVAGHAGLFARLEDVVAFTQALLSENPKPLAIEVIRWFTTRVGGNTSRGLGWDTNWRYEGSAGPHWPETAFGHTGFTGTSIWADLETRAFAILLTNRIHPTADGTGIREFRLAFHAAAAKQLGMSSAELP